MILPGHVAEATQREKQVAARDAALSNLLLQIASSIYAKLVVDEYHKAEALAAREENPYGVDNGDDDESKVRKFGIDIRGPANFSWQAATAFLIAGEILPEPAGIGCPE
jgi:hypothetical protein